MKTCSLLILIPTFLLFDPNQMPAQVSQSWVVRYNYSGSSADYAYAMVIDSEGNIIITGGSPGIGTGLDIATVKYSPSGNLIWAVRYNGPANGDDVGKAIAADVNNNIYVTGYSMGNGKDYVTIKYSSSGVQQWVQNYNGPGNGDDEPCAIAPDISGNVYVTGTSRGNGTDDDYATIKYTSAGVQQWVQCYNGPGNGLDIAYCLKLDNLANVYVTGRSFVGGTEHDYATIKYNSDGIQQWTARFNGGVVSFNIATALTIDNGGNIYVTGYSNQDFGHCDYATVKYSSNGVQQWFMMYNGPGNVYDIARGIVTDANGNIYMTGYSEGGPVTHYDYATIKYSPSGVQQWVQRYNGPGDTADMPTGIAIDRSGNVYVTGTSWNQTNTDYATIRYSTSGNPDWIQRYNGASNNYDFAQAIAVDTIGNVYVTGSSYEDATGYDYTTIKYSQTIGIEPISNEIPGEFKLYDNCPNPFNPVTTIRFDIPSNVSGQTQDVKLEMFDILGRQTALIVDEDLKPGKYEITLNGSNYSSGVYYYQLRAGDFIQSKKMVLVK